MVIEEAAIVVHEAGENVFIPRILTVLFGYIFKFKRLPFSVSVNFVMNINESEGQLVELFGYDS